MPTELGGNVAVPSAVRNSDRTTTMRVTSSPGSTVQARATSTTRSTEDVLVEAAGGGALTEIDADILRGERRRRN
jgi:hypothetical protein